MSCRHFLPCRRRFVAGAAMSIAAALLDRPASAQTADDGGGTFRDEVLAVLRRHFPQRRIEAGATAGIVLSGDHQLRLNGIEDLIRGLPTAAREARIVDWFEALDKGMSQSDDITRDFAQVRPLLRPRLWPRNALYLERLVHRPFIGNLEIVYVVDLPDTVAFVARDQAASWNVDLTTLDTLALQNLNAASHTIPYATMTSTDGKPLFANVLGGDSYDAARILLPSVRRNLEKILGPDLIAAIPTRDTFMAWPRGTPHQAEILDQVAGALAATPRPLCTDLFHLEWDAITLANAADMGGMWPDPARKH